MTAGSIPVRHDLRQRNGREVHGVNPGRAPFSGLPTPMGAHGGANYCITLTHISPRDSPCERALIPLETRVPDVGAPAATGSDLGLRTGI